MGVCAFLCARVGSVDVTFRMLSYCGKILAFAVSVKCFQYDQIRCYNQTITSEHFAWVVRKMNCTQREPFLLLILMCKVAFSTVCQPVFVDRRTLCCCLYIVDEVFSGTYVSHNAKHRSHMFILKLISHLFSQCIVERKITGACNNVLLTELIS